MLIVNISNWRTSTLYVNTSWSICSANWQELCQILAVEMHWEWSMCNSLSFSKMHTYVSSQYIHYYIILKFKGKKTYVRRAWSNSGFVRQDPLPWMLQSIVLIPVLFSHLEVFFFSTPSLWLNFPPFSPKLRKDSFALKNELGFPLSPVLVHTHIPSIAPVLIILDGNLQSHRKTCKRVGLSSVKKQICLKTISPRLF